MRIGVIGCGLWGKNHARTLGVLGALGGVADANPAASAALAAAMDCKALAVQDLIEDPGLDGLIVAVSPAMQAQVALRVLAAGRPVLVEKPIALTPAEARAVVRAAEAAGVVAMTGHLLRYHPAFEAVQALHAAGSLGYLQHLATQRWSWGRFPDGADVLFDLAPHDLAMIGALAGGLAGVAHWQGRSLVSGLCDLGELWLDLPEGLTAHCSLSRVSPERQRRLIVQGSAATVVFDDTRDWACKLCLYPAGSASAAPEARPLPLTPRPPLEAELAHFIDCIARGARPRTPLAEGCEIVELLAGLGGRPAQTQTGTQTGTETETVRPGRRDRQAKAL